MGASLRKVVVFGTIVTVHGTVVVGLLHLERESAPVAQERIAVRMISLPQERRVATPIEVKTIAPTISLQPPEVPVIDIPIVEESHRAITISVQAAAPLPSVAENDNMPTLISNVEYVRLPKPRYPPQSRKLREQGLVMLRVMIDEQGIARSIEIENSSGYSRLDHAACEAVSRAAFKPYVEDGAPRRALVLIPIEFSLNRNSA